MKSLTTDDLTMTICLTFIFNMSFAKNGGDDELLFVCNATTSSRRHDSSLLDETTMAIQDVDSRFFVQLITSSDDKDKVDDNETMTCDDGNYQRHSLLPSKRDHDENL
jgi:hypothetical protein